jgi:hypothetical protein
MAKPLPRRRLDQRELKHHAERAGVGEQQPDAGRRQRPGIVGVERHYGIDPAGGDLKHDHREQQGREPAVAEGGAERGEALLVVVIAPLAASAPGLGQEHGNHECTEQERGSGAEEHQAERPQRQHGADGRTHHPAGVRHHPRQRKVLAEPVSRHDIGDHCSRGRMQHALEDAHDDQRNGDRPGPAGQEEQQEAHADACARHQQHRTAADPVGNAADERRGQQFAAGIAAEQQTYIFGWNTSVVLGPDREERHQHAVAQPGHEEDEQADAGRPRQGPKQAQGRGQEIGKTAHVKAPCDSPQTAAPCRRSSDGRVG